MALINKCYIAPGLTALAQEQGNSRSHKKKNLQRQNYCGGFQWTPSAKMLKRACARPRLLPNLSVERPWVDLATIKKNTAQLNQFELAKLFDSFIEEQKRNSSFYWPQQPWQAEAT